MGPSKRMMMNKMNAAVFRRVGEALRVEDVEVPSISAQDDVIIQVRACGICGSDLAILEGRHPSKPPVILGHELSGEVYEVGSSVRDLNVGDHVVVDPNVNCGRCRNCRMGRRNMCEKMVEIGITKDGGFAKYMSAPDAFVYKVPASLGWRDAALIEPLSCVVHGLGKARLKPGETAVVYGAGPMGLLWASLLKKAGAGKVISVDLSQPRLRIAESVGADITVDPRSENPIERVQRETGGYGADVAIEAIGRAETVESTVRSLGPGGRAVVMGVSRKDASASFAPFDLMAKEIEVHGSNANVSSFLAAIEMVSAGSVPVERIVSHEFSISEAPGAFEMCRKGEAVKALILPS